MQDLIEAIKVRRHYNRMDLKDFFNEYEKFFNCKLSEKTKEDWKFMGLNNIDFLTMYNNIDEIKTNKNEM